VANISGEQSLSGKESCSGVANQSGRAIRKAPRSPVSLSSVAKIPGQESLELATGTALKSPRHHLQTHRRVAKFPGKESLPIG